MVEAGTGMKSVAFFTGSLVVAAIAVAVPTYPVSWRLAGGAMLLLLWSYGLWRTGMGGLRPNSPVRLLPGHALLFLALGLVGARAGFWAWLAVPPLTILLDLARRRSLALAMYAILWFGLFALLHQVVALGRDLTGTAFTLWSVGVAFLAVLYIANGARRIWRKGVVL